MIEIVNDKLIVLAQFLISTSEEMMTGTIQQAEFIHLANDTIWNVIPTTKQSNGTTEIIRGFFIVWIIRNLQVLCYWHCYESVILIINTDGWS